MNGLDDGVASVAVRWGRGGRGLVHGEQSVASVECAVADRHAVQVLAKQKPQLLVLSAQIIFLVLQSFSLQHGAVEAPHHLLQLRHALQRRRRQESFYCSPSLFQKTFSPFGLSPARVSTAQM